MNELRNNHVLRDSDDINVAQLLVPLIRYWKFLVGVSVIGTLLFFVFFYLFFPRTYMSAADFVVMVPRFKTEFQGSNSNVQYYKTLIESPALLASVEKELIERGILGKNERLEMGKQIVDSVFTKNRAEDVALSPIIRLVAYGRTPEEAYRILDTWIRHVNATVQRVNNKGKDEAISFIDREFPKQKTQYEQASKKLEDEKAEFLNSFNRLEQEKMTKVNVFDATTTRMLNEFDAKRQQMRIDLDFKRSQLRRKIETERKELRNKLISELEPELIKGEYQKVLDEYSDFRSRLKTIDVKIGSEEEVVKSLVKQKKTIPETRILKKKGLLFRSTTEIPNPDYEKVQGKIIDHRLKVSTLRAEKRNILSHLAELNKEFTQLRTKLNENEKQIHAFDVETENKLKTIDDETAMKLKIFDADSSLKRKELSDKRQQGRLVLLNHYQEAEKALNGKKDVTLSISQKQKGYLENVYQTLGEKYEQARLAKAEDEVSLKLATKPFKPVLGQPRGMVKKTIIVGLLLFMLCVACIYGRELFIRIRSEMEP